MGIILLDEAWEIDKSQLTLGRELGSGQFGVSWYTAPVLVEILISLIASASGGREVEGKG